MSCSGSHEARRYIDLHSKAVGLQGRRLSEKKPRRVQPRHREQELGSSHAVRDWSEDFVESLKG